MVIKINQGHIASALSQCEIVISLFYGSIMNYKKNEPNYRDKLIIRKVILQWECTQFYQILDISQKMN